MKKYVLSFSFAIIVICSQAQSYYENGVKEYFKDSNDLALHYFELAIQNNEDLSNAFMMRGACNTRKNKFLDATFDLKKALSLDSNNAKAYFYYGRVYLLQDFYETAIKYFNISIRKNANDPDVYDDRAICKFLNEDYINAVIDEDVAIKLNSKNDDYYTNRGFIKIKLKKYDEAIKDFDVALQINPKENQKANANKGFALFELGKFKEAIKYFTNSLLIIKDDPEMLYYRGLSYLKIENKQLACDDLKRSSSLEYKLAKEIVLKECSK